jgi:energy-coupling factor transporter ATP-binding protein EcfA2
VFGSVQIVVDEGSHELDVRAMTTASRNEQQIVVSPALFFSDAQLNVLAISMFLAGGLRQRWSRLQTLIIDDPIQQLDEMNVCAFLDLIRGLAEDRQFIVFTCSRDFYLLALDKLSCLNSDKPGRFQAYRLEGITPSNLDVKDDTPQVVKE